MPFLFAWLPLALGFFVLACRLRPAAAPVVLLATSIAFALADGSVSLAFLAASVVANYGAAHGIRGLAPGSRARRLALAAAIVANLVPLVLYKGAQQGLWPFVPARDGLPLGLAYYTLQQITCLVHAQRPGARMLGFLRHAAWGAFFAQLPAGPIAAYGRMAPQYERLGLTAPHASNVARGLTLVLAGVVKKTWIADPLARVVDAVLQGSAGGSPTMLEAWTAAWGYMLQLYFDFSAYSDIAIGIGLCFGLTLPLNFDSPLKSSSPGQYVMRWHVSLMTFVRDHVFEPTFRVARRLPIRPTARRYGVAWALATVAAYLTVAAWHTLAPLPLIQGLAVALLLIALQFLRQTGRASPQSERSRAETFLRRVAAQATLLAAVAVFALFLRVGSTAQLSELLAALIDLADLKALLGEVTAHLAGALGLGQISAVPKLLPGAAIGAKAALALVATATVVALAAPNTMQIFGIAGVSRPTTRLAWRPSATWGWATGLLLLLAVMGLTQSAPTQGFVYARF